MDDKEDEVWDAKKLASFLGYSEETVRGYSTAKPERLPPRIGGIRRPLWYRAAVMKWLAERSGMPEAPPPKQHGSEIAPTPPPELQVEPPAPVSLKMRKGRPRRPPP
jgi:predicted DNA-binding transcriptional regulator AlpA